MGLDRRSRERRPGGTARPRDTSSSTAASLRGRNAIPLEPRQRITLDPSKRPRIVLRPGERPRIGVGRDERAGREGRLRLVRLSKRRRKKS